MDSVSIAISRHDIDASHFQAVYSKSESELTKKEKAFLEGRDLIIHELEQVLAGVPKGGRILDIGSGTGHLAKWFKDKGYEVHGIEPSHAMFDYAVKNFPDIDFQKAISSKLPFENEKFDLIVSIEVLRYLNREENIKTYNEMYRVLKPGGQFFITQVNLYSTDFYFIFHKIKGIYSKIINKLHHYCNFTTSKNEIKLAKDAGFSKVKTIGVFHGTTRLSYKVTKSFGDAYGKFITKIFPSQRTDNPTKANFKGHLIVVGKK